MSAEAPTGQSTAARARTRIAPEGIGIGANPIHDLIDAIAAPGPDDARVRDQTHSSLLTWLQHPEVLSNFLASASDKTISHLFKIVHRHPPLVKNLHMNLAPQLRHRFERVQDIYALSQARSDLRSIISMCRNIEHSAFDAHKVRITAARNPYALSVALQEKRAQNEARTLRSLMDHAKLSHVFADLELLPVRLAVTEI